MPKKEEIKKAVPVLPTAEFKVGDTVTITSEIAGAAPGSKGEVTEVKNGGAHFRVNVLLGPLNGKEMLISADELTISKADAPRDENLARIR